MKNYVDGLTRQDFEVSATLADLPNLNKVLDLIKNVGIRKIIDLGCGYGGLTRYVAKCLSADLTDVYGVDVVEERLMEAKSKDINVYKSDLNKDRLPFLDNSFDLVMSFGALEHLTCFDNFFIESYRLLNHNGYIILAMPNLASYPNRIALLLGYQPRDVEISCKVSPGISPFYKSGFLGHIHSATLCAMKELLDYYRFDIVKIRSSAPNLERNRIVRSFMDKIFSFSPSLSRRFIVLAKKRVN